MPEPTAEKPEPLDSYQLAEHRSNLDAGYRGLQKAYKVLTYEVGRLEDEPGLEALGDGEAAKLSAIAERLLGVGKDLKAFALQTENLDGEADNGPQGAD
jgi:hypothetical protein